MYVCLSVYTYKGEGRIYGFYYLMNKYSLVKTLQIPSLENEKARNNYSDTKELSGGKY